MLPREPNTKLSYRSAVASAIFAACLTACFGGLRFKVQPIDLVVAGKTETVLALNMEPMNSMSGNCWRLEIPDRDMPRVRSLFAGQADGTLQLLVNKKAVLTARVPAVADIGDTWLLLRGDFKSGDVLDAVSEPYAPAMTVGVENDTGELLTDVVIRYEGSYRSFGDVPTQGGFWKVVHCPRFVPLKGEELRIEFTSHDGRKIERSHACHYDTDWSGQVIAAVKGVEDVEWEGQFVPPHE